MALPSSIIQSGTRASQPAATAVAAGTLYQVTDEPYTIERSTGAAWAAYVNSPKIIVAASDESVSNDTLQNDDELSFAVVANEIYLVELYAWFTASTVETVDVKYTFTFPAAATLTLVSPGYTTAATANTDSLIGHNYQSTTGFTAIARGVVSTATQAASSIRSIGILRVGANAGTFQLQWAQNVTTGGTPLVRKADSFLRYQIVT